MALPFEKGRVYPFWDLPPEAQRDAAVQFEEDVYGVTAQEGQYRFHVIPHHEVMAWIDQVLGPNLIDYMEDDRIVELAADIERRGLLSPPVGAEGWHRVLAVARLGWDLPFFEIVGLPYHNPLGEKIFE